MSLKSRIFFIIDIILWVIFLVLIFFVHAYGHECDYAWNGSSTDVQLSTQCQAACVYQGNNESGYNYSCSVLSNFGDDAVAYCPVCVEGFTSGIEDSYGPYDDNNDDYYSDGSDIGSGDTGCFISSLSF